MNLRCRCGGPTRVLETRKPLGGFIVNRWRKCLTCGARFKTVETIRKLYSGQGLASIITSEQRESNR